MLFDIFLVSWSGWGKLSVEHGGSCATDKETTSAVIDGALVGDHASHRPNAVAWHLDELLAK